ANRSDVARVEGNPRIHNALPQPGPVVEAPLQPGAPVTIEPGITYTHAPQVWALGFTGQNVVVASADTGQRWTHNALKPHYRGWNRVVADHDYNWHDSTHARAARPKHLRALSAPGVVRHRKVARVTRCKLLSKPNATPASRWWSPQVIPALAVPLW